MLILKIKSLVEKYIPNKNDLFTMAIEGADSEYQILEVNEKQFYEALVLFTLQIIGVFLTAWFVNFLGHIFIINFDSSFLFGVLVLPLLAILKEFPEVFSVLFIKVGLSNQSIAVKTGFHFESLDKLDLDTIENIEIVTTPLGNKLGYGTLDIYSYGSSIRVPYINEPYKTKNIIEAYVKEIKKVKA
ncbi:PH domain-containing protein [Moritella viscosa]|uniref:YdbS-like PH domain-containing protein n=1 Tax=Moritella viscosa TaxID=80854 RepID=A0ABY1HE53_9GAMM|nr:PH domain-containing protein [Moritella viscosa]SGY87643.1 Putative uncharacterized protein [Moritella viscosa]SGY94120.1 Putative uncharacterized protein [Moritella viscosa]SHO25422.1 Putative uncharacterized protein [Moritella viscosa]